MYQKFFGLLENPFTTGVSPKYFFLGKSHEEALLYLKYTVSQGEGFTLITGDKGVGKTTVCRVFIDRQDERVETAFISYSKQNPLDLLVKICQEYGIKVRRETLKDLTDAFNNFLMQKRTEGKRVVVFLDDAHKHANDVLEQLRLLSNLETTRDKLLQIVLIGRLELSDMLNSHALRPLGQRITVSYQLQPLNYHETLQYINHRIGIAGQGTLIEFQRPAKKNIYNYSKGIPLLINSVCDKVLMTAFKLGHRQVSGATAKAAMKNSLSKPKSSVLNDLFFPVSKMKLYGIGSLLIIAICLFAANLYRNQKFERPEISKIKITGELSNSQVQQGQLFNVDDIRRDQLEINELASQMKILTPSTGENINQPDDLKTQIYYSIQVGAFLVSKNAQEKMKTLIEKGYAAHIVNFEDLEGRYWHTVRIGNYPSRELAKEDANILISEYDLEAIVLPVNKF